MRVHGFLFHSNWMDIKDSVMFLRGTPNTLYKTSRDMGLMIGILLFGTCFHWIVAIRCCFSVAKVLIAGVCYKCWLIDHDVWTIVHD